MPKVLGINARNLLYIKPSHTRRSLRIIDNKLLTKKTLEKQAIPIPKTFGFISSAKELSQFDWNALPSSFALKPNRGLGGQGILVVFGKKKNKVESKRFLLLRAFGKNIFEDAWIKADGSAVTLSDIKNHIQNIVDGNFSLGNSPDIAFFEERIKILKLFKEYSYKGIPDIRVVIYNSIPVMSQLRLPTKESEGKANLHLGAVGVGIDMETGVTTQAVHHDKPITHLPGTKLSLRGIQIPEWDNILKLAIKAQRAVKSNFLGVDISIDRDRGPIILELNARPGLAIQIANMAPLKERLERVKGLKVTSIKKGAKIGQDLFGGDLEGEVEELSGKKVIGFREQITLFGEGDKQHKTFAKIDTGAYRTSICRTIADELSLTNILKYKPARGALGKEDRPIIDLTFELDGEKIRTEASIASREHMTHDVIVGRRDLKRFLIDPSRGLGTLNGVSTKNDKRPSNT